MTALTMKALESAAGGRRDAAGNPHTGYAYEYFRKEPGLNEPVLLEFLNDETIFSTGKKDERNGFTWIKNGFTWIKKS